MSGAPKGGAGRAVGAGGAQSGEDGAQATACGMRLSFVASGDYGARDGLDPDSAILVQPCDRFRGPGHYQLLGGAAPVVRHCFRMNQDAIRVVDRTRLGAPDFLDLTADEFADRVCGLVLAQLAIVNQDFAADMLAMRQVRS